MPLFDSYLPLREELYLSDVHLQALCFSFADGEILSGQRLRSTGDYAEITATFERLLLKVLRTDVALARFEQICPFNTY